MIQLSKGHPPQRAQWFAKLGDAGVRFRSATLYAELEVLHTLQPTAKAALVAEAKRDPAWFVVPPIAFLGPVRVALLLATLQTPWRFRTKRQLSAAIPNAQPSAHFKSASMSRLITIRCHYR